MQSETHMMRESADAAALLTALAATEAEGDRLRDALGAADAVIADLRREAQVASQAKADFMARMTHEMRTPLSAIIGLANLALTGNIPPKTSDYLVKIRSSARTLLDVVDDITDFSRLEKGLADLVPESFSPAVLLAHLETRFGETARNKGLTLVTRLDPDIPERLHGDHARLEQILGHLVGNAVKFTERGQVLVSIALRDRKDGRARLEFAVRDTGIGMAPETIPDMLDSFTQADGSLSRPYGGTGLGLAIVQRGVNLFGGDLQAASAPGQGTLFSFRIVLAEELPGPCPSQDDQGTCLDTIPVANGLPLAGAHILLVEDNAINQQVARENLTRFGAAVDVAGHGGEAVDMVQARAYDVVLMDVQMPVMDGLTATRRIRALPGLAELPIVALTAHALAEDRDRCLAAGMNDYLTKPIEADRLLATLGQWIAPTAAARRKAAAAAPVAMIEPDRIPPRTAAGPKSPPGLDLTTALARLGGNDRLLREVVAEFARDYAKCAVQLRRDVAAGDLEAARRLAHTVKGVAGNIAANALAAAARALEDSLVTGAVPAEAALDAFAAALDLTLDDAARLAPPAEPGPACPGANSWRILLVDDAKLNRAIFSRILKSAGHEVVSAVNGKEACRVLFGEKRPERPFDCILMDIEMPEMDGPRAARLIRGLLAAGANPPCPRDIPIVALTFHDAEAEADRCRQAGMDACLAKIFDREELLGAIGRIMIGRCPLPPTGAHRRPRADPATALPALLRGLAGHLREGSIRADEDLAALRETLAGRSQPPELPVLVAAIERYDFHGALASLGRLAASLGLDIAVGGQHAAGPQT
jgi:two-component system, sensor histidine kinase and response regulator